MKNTYNLEINQDDYPESPREWNNLGTMLCTHDRYNLGNEKNLNSSEILEMIADDLNIDIEDWQNGDIGEEDLYNRIMQIESSSGIVIPLSLYDHSGISMSTGVSRGWDSGQVGFIYASRESFIKETSYTEDELFSQDKNRIPKVGEHIKIESRDGWGKIISDSGRDIIVDFDYNKSDNFKDPINKLSVQKDTILEVMSDVATEILEGEVETYDTYLRGDVYSFTYTVTNADGDEIEQDSCSGFFGDNIKENGMLDHFPAEFRKVVEEKGSFNAYDYQDGSEFEVDEPIKETLNRLNYSDLKKIVEEIGSEKFDNWNGAQNNTVDELSVKNWIVSQFEQAPKNIQLIVDNVVEDIHSRDEINAEIVRFNRKMEEKGIVPIIENNKIRTIGDIAKEGDDFSAAEKKESIDSLTASSSARNQNLQ